MRALNSWLGTSPGSFTVTFAFEMKNARAACWAMGVPCRSMIRWHSATGRPRTCSVASIIQMVWLIVIGSITSAATALFLATVCLSPTSADATSRATEAPGGGLPAACCTVLPAAAAPPAGSSSTNRSTISSLPIASSIVLV